MTCVVVASPGLPVGQSDEQIVVEGPIGDTYSNVITFTVER